MSKIFKRCSALAVAVGVAFGLSTNSALAQTTKEKEQQTAAPVETMRIDMAKTLMPVPELLKAGNFAEALNKVREAEAFPDRNPYENFIIDRYKAPAAAGVGDDATALKSFEASLASGRLNEVDSLQMMEAVSGLYFRIKNYQAAAKWGYRYLKEGGQNKVIRKLLGQAYYLMNDFASAAAEVEKDVQETERAGQIPTEATLKLLASCAINLKDDPAYVKVLEKLIVYYPNKDYWKDMIYRTQTNPALADRLQLNLFRLRFALGLFTEANSYVAMASRSLEAGYPIEAKKVLDEGFAKGVLGVGQDAAAHKKLMAAATRDAAEDQQQIAKSEEQALLSKDGTSLIGVGFNYVLVGQQDKGVTLMEQGIKRGVLRRPDEAELRLGIAYALSGKKSQALELFGKISAGEGFADLARLWSLYVRQASR